MLGDPRVGRVVVVVLLVIFVASFARNVREGGDFQGYLEVGELVLQGRHIYAEARPGINTWPPFFALVCVPFALLARVSVYLARGVWLLLNAAIVLAMLRIVVFLVYRRRLTVTPAAGGVSIASLAVLGPLVLSSRFLLGNLDRLQINMLILLCCLAACLHLVRRQPLSAGALVGLAAAIKVLPIFFLPYFAWRRWWRALAAALVVGAAASLSPILVFGSERFAEYVRRWLAIAAGGWPVRKGNQSMYAMIDRVLNHPETMFGADRPDVLASGDPLVAGIVYVLLALAALVLVRTSRRGGADPASPQATVEFAIVLTIAVLFSPLAWKHYFVFLLLTYTVLWRAALGAGDRPSWPGSRFQLADRDSAGWETMLPVATRRRLAWFLIASFALTTLTVSGLVGKRISVALEWLSVTTLGALVALVALFDLRAALGALAPVDESHPPVAVDPPGRVD